MKLKKQILDSIEASLDKTFGNVSLGVEELGKAKQYQGKASSKQCYLLIFMIIVVVVVILLLILGFAIPHNLPF